MSQASYILFLKKKNNLFFINTILFVFVVNATNLFFKGHLILNLIHRYITIENFKLIKKMLSFTSMYTKIKNQFFLFLFIKSYAKINLYP